MRFVPPALAALVLVAHGPALAADPPAAPRQPPTDVSAVTVHPPTEAPRLVASSPAAGQALPPGVLVITFTFDQKMLATGFDLSAAQGGERPQCLKTPRLLNSGKTFALLCTTQPHKAYALALNAQPAGGGFANLDNHRAQPATLAFATTEGDGPRSIADAMKAAGLGELDVPIQDTPDLSPPALAAR